MNIPYVALKNLRRKIGRTWLLVAIAGEPAVLTAGAIIMSLAAALKICETR
jgi:hypothetical protein